ncbi:MAG: MBL fold metallo-hydrolase [Phycisphaerales bacterium]
MTAPATWSWRLLRAGAFMLDGGAMFGLIPRPIWTRAVTPDDKNRIALETNCLLLERDGALVVVEAGIGDKLTDKLRGIYNAERRTIADALREIDADPADITHVVLTHLHFDHAGGLTTLEGDRAVPVFPNAEVIVQKQEWHDALANRSTMHSTYLRDHLDPIAERVRTVEGETEALPGLRVRPVPGHTFGQQAVLFDAAGAGTVAFPGDLMPTRHHAPTTWGMAYDVESYTTMVEKARFLADAHANDWTIVLDHDPGEPVMRTQAHEQREGEFTLIEAH